MIALTRAVSPAMGRCELTHREREVIDPDRAARQHQRYERLLRHLGCRVERVAPAPGHPDAVFIEDTAVVVDELAVVARPGAASRRGEVEAVGAVLREHRAVERIEAPATLDGGDVLRLGDRVWVGRSSRTDVAGENQLRSILEPMGYAVVGVPVSGCLHLKSAITAVGDDTLLVNPRWVDTGSFRDHRLVEVDPGEPWAANALLVGGVVVVAAGSPRTRERLESAGVRTEAVDVSELAKAEGGVTCCSVLL